jgi:hypothetical protein
MPRRADFLEQLGFANSDAPVILWATNTSYASRNAQKMLHRQVARARKPEAEVRAHIADHVTQLREHSKVMLALAQRHPEWNIVIKVHPAEWINPYVELARQARNLRVAFDAPIRDFLYHCDVLVQRNCTTATEAWMLNKPVINLEVGQYLRNVRDEYRNGNHVVNSLDEAEAAIRSYLKGKPIADEQARARDAFIADFYDRVDGKASERAAELIHKTISPPSYLDADQCQTQERTKTAYLEWRESENARLANRVKDLLRIDRTSSLRFWTRFTRREPSDNLGVFTAEAEITAPMITEIYQRFDSLTLSA